MPKGSVHAMIGAFIGFGFHQYLSPTWTIIGSLMPDCDIKYAPAGKILPLHWIPGVKHRGITHTVWACVGFSTVVAWGFGLKAGGSFAVGYMSHLLADATTPMGVNWWSVSNRKKRRR